jgi:hypothetical protein
LSYFGFGGGPFHLAAHFGFSIELASVLVRSIVLYALLVISHFTPLAIPHVLFEIDVFEGSSPKIRLGAISG